MEYLPQIENIKAFKPSPYQTRMDVVDVDDYAFDYLDFPVSYKLGHLETYSFVNNALSSDVELYEAKKAKYGDTLSLYDNRSLYEQIEGKLIALGIELQFDNPQNLINETRLYITALASRLVPSLTDHEQTSEAYIRYVQKHALKILPKKDFAYGSAWKGFSPETFICLVRVKLKRHEGMFTLGVNDEPLEDVKKAIDDMTDAMNYLSFLSMTLMRDA